MDHQETTRVWESMEAIRDYVSCIEKELAGTYVSSRYISEKAVAAKSELMNLEYFLSELEQQRAR